MLADSKAETMDATKVSTMATMKVLLWEWTTADSTVDHWALVMDSTTDMWMELTTAVYSAVQKATSLVLWTVAMKADCWVDC